MMIQYKKQIFLAWPLILTTLLPGGSCLGSKSHTTPEARMASAKDMADKKVRKGQWGGEHVRMQVTDAGAEIEYDCAHGTIDQSIRLDRDGRFDVRGKHVFESGGPAQVPVPPDGGSPAGPITNEESRPARYTGRVAGNKMRLTVTILDSGVEIGTFSLTFGTRGSLTKCY